MHFWSLSFLLPISIFFFNTVTINWHFSFCPIISNQDKLEAVIEVIGNLTLHVGIILRRLLLFIPPEFLTRQLFPYARYSLTKISCCDLYEEKNICVFSKSFH